MKDHISPVQLSCSSCGAVVGMPNGDRDAFIALLEKSGWGLGRQPVCPWCIRRARGGKGKAKR